jgi:hypothetical protein
MQAGKMGEAKAELAEAQRLNASTLQSREPSARQRAALEHINFNRKIGQRVERAGSLHL